MIRIVARARLAQLEADTGAAREQARQTRREADEAFGRHVQELHAATDRAERAQTAAAEVGEMLSHALEELAASQQELLLRDIEIRRLREELRPGPREGDTLTVLLHYGEPHTIYASREDAYADTATHGADPARWVGERPASASMWRCEAFIYDANSNGFRRVHMPTPKPIEGAA
ncbi:hypothetical protein ACFC5X_21075 [Streptomyces sp. NPDC055952]|uniref:hypothetical protein n=1 Tax=Streptomyces sp. NPDC055952 TaxID=3345663 RepID=UPI0035DE4B81